MQRRVWCRDLAYGIGLLATDGCLSSDGRHIEFSSKDLELVINFKKIFKLSNKITGKSRGGSSGKRYHRIQFGDVKFYNFLTTIGLFSRKSHTLGVVRVPKYFFVDFLRGIIDGDGSIGYFMHPESKKKQFKIRITSASRYFLDWLNSKSNELLGIKGIVRKITRAYELCFYKGASRHLVESIYYKPDVIALQRKHNIAKLLKSESGETGTRVSLRS